MVENIWVAHFPQSSVGEIHESPAEGSLVQRGLARSDWGIVNPYTYFFREIRESPLRQLRQITPPSFTPPKNGSKTQKPQKAMFFQG